MMPTSIPTARIHTCDAGAFRHKLSREGSQVSDCSHSGSRHTVAPVAGAMTAALAAEKQKKRHSQVSGDKTLLRAWRMVAPLLATAALATEKQKNATARAIKLYRCTDAYADADNAPPLARRAPGTMVCQQAVREWEVVGQAAPGLPRFLFKILKSQTGENLKLLRN